MERTAKEKCPFLEIESAMPQDLITPNQLQLH